jgi:hypothetical protein
VLDLLQANVHVLTSIVQITPALDQQSAPWTKQRHTLNHLVLAKAKVALPTTTAHMMLMVTAVAMAHPMPATQTRSVQQQQQLTTTVVARVMVMRKLEQHQLRHLRRPQMRQTQSPVMLSRSSGSPSTRRSTGYVRAPPRRACASALLHDRVA